MKEVIQSIGLGRNFVVTSHVNPDGDNVGSSVAMTKFLQNIGKNAIHALSDEIPENLKFLLKNHKIFTDKEEILEHFGGEAYALVVLDSAEKSRVAVDMQVYDKAQLVINIDHHVSNTMYGDLNYVLPEISSTCEVVTGIFKAVNDKAIDEPVATAAYTGLSTDTGNFMFQSVSAETFRAAAFLTEKGADRTLVADEIYRSISLELRMLTKLLLETFTIENEIGIMLMTGKALAEAGVAYKDTESMANLGVDTRGVEVGILIKENGPDLYKISLRSKGTANVCEIAANFGGGGHHNAAGCTMHGKAEDIKKQLQDLSELQLKKDRLYA